MIFSIDTEQETDGRWIAEIPDLPGALVYGASREEAIQRVQVLALRVMADRNWISFLSAFRKNSQ
jgi:predicted RNase H-like HicB family nuclease